MAHILNAYMITVRKKQSKETLLLGNFDGNGADLLAEFEAFLRAPEHKDWHDPEAEAAARVDQVYSPTPDAPGVLAAWVKAGEMGVTSELVRTDDDALGAEVVFQRQPEHAELIPVLMLLQLPGTHRHGFLVAHSPKGRGVKTKFWTRFTTWFAQRHPDYKVDMPRTIPEGFQKRLLEEESLKKVTLTRYRKPSDFAASENQWLRAGDLGKIVTTIQAAGRMGFLKKTGLKSALKDDADLSHLLTFQGEEYDEVSTTFRDGNGRDHTLIMKGKHVPRGGYDVTSRVKEDEYGNPTYESLREAALDYLTILDG
ncbi:hypothetical protein ACFP63_08595 [Oerskovia jenensis]|uniref:Uncharacterized protein n=1 Tax=Oerskovia jenensis TaxID=162169 RepID=A0ABS2LIZ6_9CELL|nr:hypothetical protein [Oerskovia jenensis]MBM7480109.1 hypothetical protein [Oerskovia jenensis]